MCPEEENRCDDEVVEVETIQVFGGGGRGDQVYCPAGSGPGGSGLV